MCIIIVKPAGVDVPQIQILDNCMLRNNHGFGFAVAGEKPFKTLQYNDFINAVYRIDIYKPAVIHFRYATHGSVKTANVHPFKIGDVAFAHNGILNIDNYKDLTDSETAFKYILNPAIKTFGFGSKGFERSVETIIGGSRFAFVNDKGVVKMYGNFVQDYGCYFSNTGYNAETFEPKNKYGYGKYYGKYYGNKYNEIPF